MLHVASDQAIGDTITVLLATFLNVACRTSHVVCCMLLPTRRFTMRSACCHHPSMVARAPLAPCGRYTPAMRACACVWPGPGADVAWSSADWAVRIAGAASEAQEGPPARATPRSSLIAHQSVPAVRRDRVGRGRTTNVQADRAALPFTQGVCIECGASEAYLGLRGWCGLRKRSAATARTSSVVVGPPLALEWLGPNQMPSFKIETRHGEIRCASGPK
jgi:hypothetical protein